jgi:hypothetical protein
MFAFALTKLEKSASFEFPTRNYSLDVACRNMPIAERASSTHVHLRPPFFLGILLCLLHPPIWNLVHIGGVVENSVQFIFLG